MAKKGRKRNVTARRRPCGEVVERPQAEREQDILGTGLAARSRLFGLSDNDVRDPAAGTEFGRAYLSGQLSPNDRAHNRGLYHAGLEFERRRRAYRNAIAAKGVPSAGDLDRVHGFDGDEPEDLVEARLRAMRSYSDIRNAILSCGQPLAMFACETWILEDKPIMSLLGDLCSGLNAVRKVMDTEMDGRRSRLTA